MFEYVYFFVLSILPAIAVVSAVVDVVGVVNAAVDDVVAAAVVIRVRNLLHIITLLILLLHIKF